MDHTVSAPLAWPRHLSGRGHRTASLLLAGTGVFLLSFGAVAAGHAGPYLALWWPAAGLSALMALRAPAGPARLSAVVTVALASGVANAAAGRPWLVAACFGAANAAEAAVVAWVLDRSGSGVATLVTVKDLMRLLVATIAGTAVIALLVGATVLVLLDGPFGTTIRIAAASHASALLLLVPFGLRGVQSPGEARVRERTAQALLLVFLLLLVFSPTQHLPIALLPAASIVWAALRCGTRTVLVELLFFACAATLATLHGWGPFGVATGGLQDELLPASLVQGSTLVITFFALSVATSVEEKRSALADLERLAMVDSLTGLGNRRTLTDRLQQAMVRGRRGERGSLLLLDLDRFKAVNDFRGHEIGDQLLQAVAARLRTLVRETDTVVRLGGDEFVLLCPGLVWGTADAEDLRGRIVGLLERPFTLDGHDAVVGVSVGGVSIDPACSHSELLRLADADMYAVKARRRAGCVPTRP